MISNDPHLADLRKYWDNCVNKQFNHEDEVKRLQLKIEFLKHEAQAVDNVSSFLHAQPDRTLEKGYDEMMQQNIESIRRFHFLFMQAVNRDKKTFKFGFREIKTEEAWSYITSVVT